MDLIKQFREYTRQLECRLGNMNQSDCCCCGISTMQCFLIVEIGRKPGISVKELALKISTQFGGGARKGEMCGSVTRQKLWSRC